jgi:hypothetical protein
MVAKLSLVECMATVEDPKLDQTKAHDLHHILVLSVLAMLCGADDWEDIGLFAKIRFWWLKKFIKLRNGVLSHDIISRVVCMIRREAFQEAFLAWVSGLKRHGDCVSEFFHPVLAAARTGIPERS